MLKKIISVIMAVVIIIAGVTYVPQIADAEEWEVVKNSNNVYFYANANGMNVINVQKPLFAAEEGIYITTGAAIVNITINEKQVGTESAAIQGGGAVVYLSALTAKKSTVCFYAGNGNQLGSIDIQNINGSDDNESGGETPTEPDGQPGKPGSSDISAPEGVSAYNFYAQGKGYRIDFDTVDGAVSYNVYMDNSSTAIANVPEPEKYVGGDAFSKYADNQLHSLYVGAVDKDGNVSVRSKAASLRVTSLTNSSADPTDISRIYVVTNGGIQGGQSITKENKTPASLTIISGEGIVNTVSDGGTIKLRGNSTALADKPAYNISFSSKQQVFTDAAKAKKWSLLANAFEKTMMRNKLAMDLGRELGNVASPEEHYAEMYIDGVYKGTFLISEPAENGRAGIDYDDSDTSNEMMFEYEKERVEAEQTYYTTDMGMRFVVADPEGLSTNTDRYRNWVATLRTFENALKNYSSDEVLKYINVDSFVDMYIVNEVFNTVDFGYSSVKFYIKNDEQGNPIIYGGPLWDFDLSSGNYSAEEARRYDKFRCQEINLWFNYLMKNQTFKKKVIAKFKEMQPVIQNIYKENQLGISRIDTIQEHIHNSRVRNYTSKSQGGAGWSETEVDSAEHKYFPYSYGTVAPYNTYTYDQHVEYLRNWLENKDKWMCEQWGIDYTLAGSDGVMLSKDIDVTGYQMTASLNGIEGNMGFRVVYQVEDLVENQKPEEIGLVYGLVFGDNPIKEKDVLYGSGSEYVKSYKATDAGKLSVIMGDSKTATYYVRTMSCGEGNNVSTEAYTSTYYVRAYAKFSDGNVVYSPVKKYNVFRVADVLYQNQLVSRKATFDYLYTKILKYVDTTYREREFDWSAIVVK